MQPEAIELEKLRQEIEYTETIIGDRSDYLDLGRPTPEQARKAEQEMEDAKAKLKVLKAKIHERLEQIRKDSPQALQEWVGWHTGILKKILAEPKTDDRDQGVRHFVAKQTLEEWENVLAGKRDYALINFRWMPDYMESARAIAASM